MGQNRRPTEAAAKQGLIPSYWQLENTDLHCAFQFSSRTTSSIKKAPDTLLNPNFISVIV